MVRTESPAADLAPSTPVPPPNPPSSTFASERFIAWHMMRLRMIPEAPTSAPETISA
jgi:hypothetical protein